MASPLRRALLAACFLLGACTYRAQQILPDVVGVVLTASPDAVPADGYNTAQVQLQLNLSNEAPVDGFAVSFAVDGHRNDAGLTQLAPSTDANGIVTATLSSTVAGPHHVAASIVLGGAPTLVDHDVVVTFLPTDGSVAVTATSPTPLMADGVTTSNLTATITDSQGSPVANAPVTFGAQPTGRTTVTPASQLTTDSHGQATATLTSTVAASITASATSPYGLGSAAVTFVPGPADSSTTLVVASPNTTFADGSSAVTLSMTVEDAFSNPIPGQTVTWGSNGTGNTFSVNPSVTDANGLAQTLMRSTVAAYKAVTATSGPVVSATLAIFDPPPVQAKSTIMASPNSLVGDGVTVSAVTVTLQDSNGIAVVGYPIVMSASNTNTTFVPVSGATDSNGKLVSGATCPDLAVDILTATAGAVVLNTNVTFGLGPPDPNTSSFTITPAGGVVADGNHQLTLQVIARDVRSRILTNQTVAWSTAAPGPLFAQAQNVTHTAGDANARAVSLYAGTTRFYATLQRAYVLSATGTFLPQTPWCTNGNVQLPGPPRFEEAGGRAYDVVSVDVNHDGHLDLINASDYQDGPFVALGRGDGTFQTPFQLTDNPSNPLGGSYNIAVTDMTHDGLPDVVVPGSSEKIGVYVNLGGGNWVVHTPFPANLSNISRLCTGDFNGDSNVDIALLSQDYSGPPANENTVMFAFGDGHGGLTQGPYLAFSGGLTQCIGQDLDKDGHVDLVIGSYTDHAVYVLMNLGNANFAPPVPYATFNFQYPIALADVNKDGNADLIAGGCDIMVFLGNGDGTFSRIGSSGHCAVGTSNGGGYSLMNLSIVDLNQDTFSDIVASDLWGFVAVGIGNGTGAFTMTEYSIGAQSLGLTSADFNGDNFPDIATTLTWGSSMAVYTSAGSAVQFPNYPAYLGWDSDMVATADLNGDGHLDSVNAGIGKNNVWLAVGVGDGNFLPAVATVAPHGTNAIRVGPIAGNGNLSVAVADANDSYVSIFAPNISAGLTLATQIPVSGVPNDLDLVDMNNDGLLDVVTASLTSNNVTVAINHGGLAFSIAGTGLASAPYGLAVADFDGDGHPDVVTTNTSAGTITTLIGSRTGALVTGPTQSVGTQPAFLRAGDFNGDGQPDLVVGENAAAFVSVLLGKNDGTFFPQTQYPLVASASFVAVADINRDGHQDLLAATHTGTAFGSGNGGSLSVLLGAGDGTFAAAMPYQTGEASGIAVGDYNGDGKQDVLVGNRSDGIVGTLLATGCK